MADAKRLVEIAIKAHTGDAESGIDGLTKKLTGLSAKQLAVAGAAVTMGAALAKAFVKATAAAAEFEKSMAEVRTLTNATAADSARLGDKIQRLSVEFGQVDKVMAKASYNVVSAGFADIAEQTELLAVSAKAAIAGVTDVNTSAKVITQTLNAYKLSATDANWVSDILFTTVKGGVTTFEELSGSLGKVNAIAAAAGISFDEVAAAMAVLTKNGLNSEESATALRGLIVAIGAASGESKEKLDALGITLDDGLAPALAAINRAGGDSLGTLRELIPDTSALNAAASAGANGAMQLKQQLIESANSAGATDQAFKIMNETVDQSKAAFEAARKAAQVAWGDMGLPGAKDYYDGLTGFFIVLTEAIEAAETAADSIGKKLEEAGFQGLITKSGGELKVFIGGPQAENRQEVKQLTLMEQAANNSEALVNILEGRASPSGGGSQLDQMAMDREEERAAREREQRLALPPARPEKNVEVAYDSFLEWAASNRPRETTEDISELLMDVPVTDGPGVLSVTDEQLAAWEAQKELILETKYAILDMGAGFAGVGAQGISTLLGLREGAFMMGDALKNQVATALETVIQKLIIVKLLNPFMGFLGLADGGTVPGYAAGGSVPRAAAGMVIPNIGQAGLDSVPILAMPGEGVIKRDTMMRLETFLNAHNNAAPVGDIGGQAAASVVHVNYQISRPVSYRDHLDLGENAVAAQRAAARRVV